MFKKIKGACETLPYYELRCENCKHEFTVKASIQERTEKQIYCPSCQSNELANIYRTVNILRYKNKACDHCPGLPDTQHGCCGNVCRFE